jgi:hypothetical protein
MGAPERTSYPEGAQDGGLSSRGRPRSRGGAQGIKIVGLGLFERLQHNETFKTFTFKLCYPLMTVHISAPGTPWPAF